MKWLLAVLLTFHLVGLPTPFRDTREEYLLSGVHHDSLSLDVTRTKYGSEGRVESSVTGHSGPRCRRERQRSTSEGGHDISVLTSVLYSIVLVYVVYVVY